VESSGISTGTRPWLQLGQLRDKRRGIRPSGTLWNLREYPVVIDRHVAGTLSAWNASGRCGPLSSTRRSQTHGSATNKTECNTQSIMYNAPLAHQEPSILSSFRTFSSARMIERRYQLTVPVRRDLKSWDFRVPVSLECKFVVGSKALSLAWWVPHLEC